MHIVGTFSKNPFVPGLTGNERCRCFRSNREVCYKEELLNYFPQAINSVTLTLEIDF